MSFKDSYPDYAAIEEHIRRARIERSVVLAQLLANAIDGAWKGLTRVGEAIRRTYSTRFVKGPVPAPIKGPVASSR